MPQRSFSILVVFFALSFNALSQPIENISLNFIKKEAAIVPGKVLNLAFFLNNNSSDTIEAKLNFTIPDEWKIITRPGKQFLHPGKKQFFVLSVQAPANYPVNKYSIIVDVINSRNNTSLISAKTDIRILEIEKISLQILKRQEHVYAGESISATYLVQNLGNTTKTIYISTNNCDVIGSSEIKLKPRESTQVSVSKLTSNEIADSRKESYTIRAMVKDKVVKSIFNTAIVFPSKNAKKDLFFRFPVTASTSYLSTNQQNNFESAWQFQLFGSGSLDPEGNHRLEFLARGPNNTDLSFLGLYDQYYIAYSNKNIELFVGEKSFTFTPLTESSRFGIGTENKIIFNNGLGFGFLYVKPRFFQEIENELAAYTDFRFNEKNKIGIYYITKKYHLEKDLTHMASFTSSLKPFEKTSIDFEFSRGTFKEEADNAFRTNLNTQFSIFQIAGNYYYTGKNFPGYYNNSKFYSVSLFAKITPKLSAGIYAKEDFANAQLDTFFVTAPYSKSIQSSLNYNIATGTYLKLYWRQYERKDRLSKDKFHYKTNSINTHFRQRFRKVDYSLLGEFGETTNFLLEPEENQQNTFRGTVNIAYKFNSQHSIRAFGSWSNVNQFVSGEQRNITAGLSATSKISKNLRVNFHIQNAYDIDDYYRNRNLMQLNLEYKFLKQHSLSLRSFYTIFKQEVDNPEFTMAATYAYSFGVPVKQVIKAGSIRGQVINDNGEPIEGILINSLNKSAISDKNGEFEFKSIQPGKHFITIDRSKLGINEITNIPSPLEIDVLEDNETILNFKITKGAKLFGEFKFKESDISVLKNSSANLKNIIIELKTRTNTYRITTDENGRFSFPLVRPGQLEFKIYSNSIPNGYLVEKNNYSLVLAPGEKKAINIPLVLKKRNIIFKSQNISVSKKGGSEPFIVASKTNKSNGKYFYTVQIGAFSKPIERDSEFLKGEQFYFEKQIDNLHKYYIGRFNSLNDAIKERDRLKLRYKNAFIVVIENGEVTSVQNFQNNKK